ncbi:hypothetical protein HCH_01522 [Hahella chejuensis KCTC 2396]|uniref:Uncharacterized protein n=1 Tax=Hahella chejuensis (strain KCTC 2396) TaxID=349521 RepID=Q2SLU4_HAHCH|nr:hypothetical protein HCH_01522 [Hahella chejuensis KCTC 2396]
MFKSSHPVLISPNCSRHSTHAAITAALAIARRTYDIKMGVLKGLLEKPGKNIVYQ